MVEYIKTLKYYYHETTLNSFIYQESNFVHDGHPSVSGAKMWAKHLVQVLEKYYE